MTGVQTLVPAVLAVVEGEQEVQNFPLSYQIACAILAALFLLTFSIGRDPRGWRRLYQSRFTRKEDFSVNRNKKIDENVKKYGISVSMIFLVAAVSFFVLGVTYRQRHTRPSMTPQDKFRQQDTERILENAPKNAARRSVGG
jgi:hypothetical protein